MTTAINVISKNKIYLFAKFYYLLISFSNFNTSLLIPLQEQDKFNVIT